MIVHCCIAPVRPSFTPGLPGAVADPRDERGQGPPARDTPDPRSLGTFGGTRIEVAGDGSHPGLRPCRRCTTRSGQGAEVMVRGMVASAIIGVFTFFPPSSVITVSVT